MLSFNPATSAISLSASALSFLALAWPISLDAALRRACACSSLAMALRRRSSMLRSVLISASSSAAGMPRRRSPRANSSAFSRIHLMSCMALVLRGRHGRTGHPDIRRCPQGGHDASDVGAVLYQSGEKASRGAGHSAGLAWVLAGPADAVLAFFSTQRTDQIEPS